MIDSIVLLDSSTFATSNLNPIAQFFTLLGNFMGSFITLLDFPFYGEIRFIRLIIGFIVLSAIITVFWKGAKG